MNNEWEWFHVAWRWHGELFNDPKPCRSIQTCSHVQIMSKVSGHAWGWECLGAVCPLETCERRRAYWKHIHDNSNGFFFQ